MVVWTDKATKNHFAKQTLTQYSGLDNLKSGDFVSNLIYMQLGPCAAHDLRKGFKVRTDGRLGLNPTFLRTFQLV